MPMGKAMTIPTASEASPSSSVRGSFCQMDFTTGWAVSRLAPKSPRIALLAHSEVLA